MNELIASLLGLGVFFAGAILYEIRVMRNDLSLFSQRLSNMEGRIGVRTRATDHERLA